METFALNFFIIVNNQWYRFCGRKGRISSNLEENAKSGEINEKGKSKLKVTWTIVKITRFVNNIAILAEEENNLENEPSRIEKIKGMKLNKNMTKIMKVGRN